MIKLILALVFITASQSCSAAPEKAADASTSDVKLAKVQVPNSIVKKEPRKMPEEPKQYEPGDSFKASFAAISVKDKKGKLAKVADFMNHKKNNIVLFVKKGCVFCDSLLAELGGKSYKSNLILVTDKRHASFDEFVQKQKNNSSVDGTWLYDFEDKFAMDLKFHSFPTILVLDNNQKVIIHQSGLRMVDDPNELQGLPFPKALAKLTKHTAKWMKQY